MVVPLLVAVAVMIGAIAVGSHWWVRAESAARVAARAHAVGAPVPDSVRGVAPPGARVRVEEPGQAEADGGGVRVVVPRGAGGRPIAMLPRLGGWSPWR